MLLLVLTSLWFVGSAVGRPQPCCIPYEHSIVILTYQGTVPIGTANAEIAEEIIEISADYHNMIEGVVVHVLDRATNTRTAATSITFFNNGTRYIIPGDGNCYTAHVEYEWMQPRCIPDNYTYEGSFRIGSSAHGFMVNGWTGPWVREMTTIYLTADECIPVAETYHGVTHDGKHENLRSYLYTDFQKNVLHTERVNLPPACYRPVPIPVGKRHLGRGRHAYL